METKHTDLSSLKIDRSNDKQNYGTSKKNIPIIIISSVIILLVLAYFIFNSVANSALEVKLVTVSFQTPSQTGATLTASGYVVAQRKAAVASKGTGRLVYLGVVEGDKVKKDQIIARLEDNDVKAQLAEAKANLELQDAGLKETLDNFNRQKALLKTGSSTQADYDAAEANYKRTLSSIDVAKAQVQSAEVALENTIIRAPFNGTVLTKNADVGEIVAPLAAGINSRAAVVTIADMSSLQVEADVSESNIEKIIPNQDCEIVLDAYPNYSYPGYVFKIVPTADRTKATVMVKVGFKNYDSRVLPEMSAKVLFLSNKITSKNSNRTPPLIVPSSAVVNRNGKQLVFEVKNNKAIEIPVETGQRFDSYIEIKSGISNGTQVIENVSDKIKGGRKVKIKD